MSELSWRIIVWRATGGAIAVLAMYFLADIGHVPLMLVPFATSIVLVIGSPFAEPAQPRALVGGHLISTATGLAMMIAFGGSIWIAAAAVGIAIALMLRTRTFHPPAGIDPLIVVIAQPAWHFLLVPVAAGAILLALFAYLWHNATERGAWPARWW